MPGDTPVDILYQDFQTLLNVIENTSEGNISLETALRVTYSRSLFIASASYFEEQIERQVIDFVHSCTSGSELLKELVRQKTFERQYHTLFDWAAKNVNRFFSLFGNDFSQSMQQYTKNHQEYENAIRAFLEIGGARNSIAHKDYFHFPIDNKTTEEVYSTYKTALQFVNSIGTHLERVNNEIFQ